jgi:hypothetical protein
MAIKYKTRAAVLDALNDERTVYADEVSARARRSRIWVYGSGLPGCLYDNGPYYTDSKRNAIACCVDYACAASESMSAPRGMVTELRNGHSFTDSDGTRYEVSEDTLSIALATRRTMEGR